MNTRTQPALLVAAALAFAAACPTFAQALDSPSTTPAQGVNVPVDVQGDGRQQALDQATTKSVKAILQLDSELKTQTILVETINGIVRLTGQANSAALFSRAKDVVAHVEGVKSVDNQLVVREVRPQ
ncbi:MAG: BON domain-containing protein [Betaproteobacteria bacterium]